MSFIKFLKYFKVFFYDYKRYLEAPKRCLRTQDVVLCFLGVSEIFGGIQWLTLGFLEPQGFSKDPKRFPSSFSSTLMKFLSLWTSLVFVWTLKLHGFIHKPEVAIMDSKMASDIEFRHLLIGTTCEEVGCIRDSSQGYQ